MCRKYRLQSLFGLFAIVMSAGLTVYAQTLPPVSPSPTAPPKPSLESDFFKNILLDQKAIWTAPAHLHRGDAKWMIPSGIGAMALFTTDRISGDEIAEFSRQIKTSRVVSYAGSIYGVGAVAAGFYIAGRKTNNYRARETGILIAEAGVDGLIVSDALKVATQRARPAAQRERSEFFDGGSSFPSGHSTQAWAAATIIANEYHGHRTIQIAAYGLASAVSLSRFTVGKHYISDVLLGSALGYGIGRYVYRTHHREDDGEQTKTSRWPRILPQYSRGERQYGVGLTWSF